MYMLTHELAGLRSDVGGSIRIPAHWCGLFGHKPTGGYVSNENTWPTAKGLVLERILSSGCDLVLVWQVSNYCQLGPLCRHAEDLMPMLRMIARPEQSLGDPSTVQLRGMQVLDCRHLLQFGASARHQDELSAHAAAVQALARAGCVIVPAPVWPEMVDAFAIWAAMLGDANEKSGGIPFRQEISMGKSAEIWVLLEMFKWMLGGSEHTFPALGLALLERVTEGFPGQVQKLKQQGEQLRKQLRSDIGEGVLLFPSLPLPAPEHGEMILRVFDSGATSIFNVTELPATAVPLGLSKDGLPVGLQVVADSGNDHKSIAVAMMLDKALGGWARPLRDT